MNIRFVRDSLKSDLELRDLLTRELQHAQAPADLWTRIDRELGREPARRRSALSAPWTWALVGAVILILLLLPASWVTRLTPGSTANQQLDLRGYLAPSQDASGIAGDPAISRAPLNFANITASVGPKSVGMYSVAAERQARVGGEQVKQVVLRSPADTATVFIAPPKVRMNAGSNSWVASNLEGVACKRLNCPRVRMVQFPCAPEMCIVVCKTCSEKVMRSLMTQVMASASEFR